MTRERAWAIGRRLWPLVSLVIVAFVVRSYIDAENDEDRRVDRRQDEQAEALAAEQAHRERVDCENAIRSRDDLRVGTAEAIGDAVADVVTLTQDPDEVAGLGWLGPAIADSTLERLTERYPLAPPCAERLHIDAARVLAERDDRPLAPETSPPPTPPTTTPVEG